MSEQVKICAFTGHRQIKSEHQSTLPDLLARAVNYAYSEGCRVFLSGGAIGFDTMAAREVIRFRLTHPDVKLVMLLPCLNQDERWSDAQKDAYDYVLSAANEVRYISEQYDADCMRRRNLALAEECDIMISYVYKQRSGSSQTARMAKLRAKAVYNLATAVK